MKIYTKAILPIGFKASALACGIKKSGKLDLALFYSEVPANAACKFTSNKVQAAPIKLNQQHLKLSRYIQAVLVNSGNANCFTGEAGFRDAQATGESVAKALQIRQESVLVNSTGVIGRRLPVAKIKKAIPRLVRGLEVNGIDKAKKAILTTDTFTKEITLKFNIAGRPVTLCGIAKGAGMIAPNMATMLCFIFTDAHVGAGVLNKALSLAVKDSFNCITVDGCMSTNDTVALLANGATGNKPITTARGFTLFARALNIVCLELAKMIVRDAEGTTKFITIKVSQAKTYAEAKKIALCIANSNLFKAAIFGENPNFGRIVAAIGASGVDIKEEEIKIKVSPLDKREIGVDVTLARGNSSARVYTSDLTVEYVKINAEYN